MQPPSLAEQILILRRGGKSYRAIAAELNICVMSAFYILSRATCTVHALPRTVVGRDGRVRPANSRVRQARKLRRERAEIWAMDGQWLTPGDVQRLGRKVSKRPGQGFDSRSLPGQWYVLIHRPGEYEYIRVIEDHRGVLAICPVCKCPTRRLYVTGASKPWCSDCQRRWKTAFENGRQ